MNNINGVFVETALRTAMKNSDLNLLATARDLFAKADTNGDGILTWDDFEAKLDTGEMKEYFAALHLDVNEGATVFHLIDADGSGELDAHEFVNGCFRLRGPAKGVEFASFLKEYEVLSAIVQSIHDHVAVLLEHSAADGQMPKNLASDTCTPIPSE